MASAKQLNKTQATRKAIVDNATIAKHGLTDTVSHNLAAEQTDSHELASLTDSEYIEALMLVKPASASEYLFATIDNERHTAKVKRNRQRDNTVYLTRDNGKRTTKVSRLLPETIDDMNQRENSNGGKGWTLPIAGRAENATIHNVYVIDYTRTYRNAKNEIIRDTVRLNVLAIMSSATTRAKQNPADQFIPVLLNNTATLSLTSYELSELDKAVNQVQHAAREAQRNKTLNADLFHNRKPDSGKIAPDLTVWLPMPIEDNA